MSVMPDLIGPREAVGSRNTVSLDDIREQAPGRAGERDVERFRDEVIDYASRMRRLLAA